MDPRGKNSQRSKGTLEKDNWVVHFCYRSREFVFGEWTKLTKVDYKSQEFTRGLTVRGH